MTIEDQVAQIATDVAEIKTAQQTQQAPVDLTAITASISVLQTGVTALLAQENLNADGTPASPAPEPAPAPAA